MSKCSHSFAMDNFTCSNCSRNFGISAGSFGFRMKVSARPNFPEVYRTKELSSRPVSMENIRDKSRASASVISSISTFSYIFSMAVTGSATVTMGFRATAPAFVTVVTAWPAVSCFWHPASKRNAASSMQYRFKQRASLIKSKKSKTIGKNFFSQYNYT